jgi:hypothetical protein
MISCHRCRPPPIYFLSVNPIALHQKKRKRRDIERERESGGESNRVLVRCRFYDMKRKEKEKGNSIYVDKRGFDEI